MNTLQQRTSRMVWNHLGNAKSGRALNLAAVNSGNGRIIVRNQDATPEAPFAAPVDVINYALTLEHIEATFYREAVAAFAAADYEAAGFQAGVMDRIAAIADHEKAHVDALTAVVGQLKGTPVEESKYAFGYTDLTSFLATAAVIEGVGVAAYGGAAQYLQGENDLLTAALTIHGVEARHAAYLNVVTGTSPFPDAFNAPMTPADVVDTVTPFFVK
jgi:Ferritin-like domain